ncbi:MAG: GDP-mannose 4,6-dehydratase [Bdellovibrionales bacterium]|nr:GDP-mannose 4,6-dehydratase [Bdellovibrionales bacterium]
MSDFWRGKNVFLTGHTGFKGSWLSLWLQVLGANVTGYALEPPTSPSMFTEAEISSAMSSHIGDIRNSQLLIESLRTAKPEIVFHMAAQPLVRYSYANPIETYDVNVMGTVRLLDAIRTIPGIKAVVVVTTDKCYDNKEWTQSPIHDHVQDLQEHDALGRKL